MVCLLSGETTIGKTEAYRNLQGHLDQILIDSDEIYKILLEDPKKRSNFIVPLVGKEISFKEERIFSDYADFYKDISGQNLILNKLRHELKALGHSFLVMGHFNPESNIDTLVCRKTEASVRFHTTKREVFDKGSLSSYLQKAKEFSDSYLEKTKIVSFEIGPETEFQMACKRVSSQRGIKLIQLKHNEFLSDLLINKDFSDELLKVQALGKEV